MTYGQLTRFILPLTLTLVVQGLSGQFLSGGMARVPRATQVLASYGLAWGLVDFLASPLSQVRIRGGHQRLGRPELVERPMPRRRRALAVAPVVGMALDDLGCPWIGQIADHGYPLVSLR